MNQQPDSINIAAISDRHIRRIDKLYRMHGGLSSNLLSYDDQVIELEIRKTARWNRSPEVTARQLADSWRSGNAELSGAVAFLVHLYEQHVPTGFSVAAEDLKTMDALDVLVAQIKQMANPSPDILIAKVRGRFDHPPPHELP